MTRTQATPLLTALALTVGFAGGWAAHARRPAPPAPDPVPSAEEERLRREVEGLKAVYDLERQNHRELWLKANPPPPPPTPTVP